MILIVEDDANNRRLFSLNLEARGYKVREAATGIRALELIRQHPPSVMLLDINLPGMSGWDVLQHLDQEHMPDFPVVVVSALNYYPEEKKREFPRIVRMITKPFSAEELIEAVEGAL